MKAIKNLYVIITMVVLMIVRPFAPGEWFGSIVVAGLFVTWLDTIHKVWRSKEELSITKQKERYAIVIMLMVVIGLILLIFIVVNFIVNIALLNSSVILDEITLLALLLCLSQDTLVSLLINIIKNAFKGE